MSILSETKLLLQNLEKVKENLGLNKVSNTSGGLFNSLEVRRGSKESSTKEAIVKSMMVKPKKYYFRISFLKSSIQFLDLKSILNLSLVNKEFSYFIKSVYFYKFMDNIKKSKLRREQNLNKKKETLNQKTNEFKTPIKQSGGLFGNFVGAIGSIGSALGLGYSSTNKPNINKNEIDPKLLDTKINIYEKILKTKLNNSEITKQIKEMRDNIDALIINRIGKKDSVNIQNNRNFLNDDEIETIKRDKKENEYKELEELVNSLKLEVKLIFNNYYYIKA